MDFSVDRYSRHRLLDWFDQDQISSTRVLVVGAGAIGNEVLKNLALLGVQHLTVIDLDKIEVHNLTRSVLFRESDVGRSKSEVAAERIKEMLPESSIIAIDGSLESVLRPSRLRLFDIVFACLDNFEARLSLDAMCRLAGVLLVNGAIDARYATVETYPYNISRQCGCYSCNLPAGAFQRIAQRYSCGWLRRVGLVEKKVPTTIITSSIVASMMISWGLRLGKATNAPQSTSMRLLIDTFLGSSNSSELPRSEQCSACGDHEGSVEFLHWDSNLDIDAAYAVGRLQVQLPGEIVFAAKCTNCGADASRTVPVGSRLRNHSTEVRICTSCHVEAVTIDARDSSELREMVAAMRGKLPDVPYVLINIGVNLLCLEIKNE